MDEYYSALAECGDRYWKMSIDASPVDLKFHLYDLEMASLRNFILTFREAVQDKLPLMKLNRWLGYIQGCLIERGYTTVQVERDWTRPLFRPLDFKET